MDEGRPNPAFALGGYVRGRSGDPSSCPAVAGAFSREGEGTRTQRPASLVGGTVAFDDHLGLLAIASQHIDHFLGVLGRQLAG